MLRGHAPESQPLRARHRRGLHTAQLAGHVESAGGPDPGRAALGPHHLPGAGDQRRRRHRSFSSDAQRIYDALAGTDKTRTSIDTDHYFTTPGARDEQADTIANWIADRWR
ncbi:hypothetical protein NIIDMKKI_70640 [Mycobacterium kansasii]|uniref:Uncharacterized protein n=1 Tax=Mycobacterium kansasii TaxID=1768 RepID=A0A7G1ISV9_MYCKA|nr:hypothetical protein NIIDMKKI_70640 [Mycobacterium kansasii]